MSRKSLLLTLLTVLGLGSSIAAVLLVLVLHEPRFYIRAAVPPGAQRTQWNAEFQAELFNRLVTGIANQRNWEARFQQEWINSYFAEDYLTKHSAENPLPEGISEPRISLEPDHIRLGFRYGKGPLKTVVSLQIRIWLVAREVNTVALEFESLHAGALPVSAQSLLQRIADFAHQKDIDPTWYRRNGHPVLVLRFQANRSHPTFLLQRLEPSAGGIRISGRSLDSTPLPLNGTTVSSMP
jgi:hypothetical protein